MAVSSPGSVSDKMTRIFLKSLGLRPDVDVIIMVVESESARLVAMDSGQVAVTVLTFPGLAR